MKQWIKNNAYTIGVIAGVTNVICGTVLMFGSDPIAGFIWIIMGLTILVINPLLSNK